ncbi:MAG: 30S ribosomal protein S16 [Candidatus Kapabacteria bacterium]|nr:30S ribosomal protein S16 [Candidatus Kapabacteria bacterium]
MVKLRLRRKGRIHHPVYDIIAIDGRARRDGAFIERLGYYDPHIFPSKVSIDADRAAYWLDNGAQPTDVVKHLLSYEGVLLRRFLKLKGKDEVEIAAEVEKHKAVSLARYNRRHDLRKKREAEKAKAKAEADKEKS